MIVFEGIAGDCRANDRWSPRVELQVRKLGVKQQIFILRLILQVAEIELTRLVSSVKLQPWNTRKARNSVIHDELVNQIYIRRSLKYAAR